MSIRLEKPWTPLQPDGVARVRGHLGVYEIGDEDGEVRIYPLSWDPTARPWTSE